MKEDRTKSKIHTFIKILDKQIKRKIKEARETWLSEQRSKIEELEKKFESFNVHKKFKEIIRMKQTRLLRDTD